MWPSALSSRVVRFDLLAMKVLGVCRPLLGVIATFFGGSPLSPRDSREFFKVRKESSGLVDRHMPGEYGRTGNGTEVEKLDIPQRNKGRWQSEIGGRFSRKGLLWVFWENPGYRIPSGNFRKLSRSRISSKSKNPISLGPPPSANQKACHFCTRIQFFLHPSPTWQLALWGCS